MIEAGWSDGLPVPRDVSEIPDAPETQLGVGIAREQGAEAFRLSDRDAGRVDRSSTLNNGMLPRMADFLMYMRGLRPTNKVGASFGSYGWSGEAVKMMNEVLKDMNIILCHKGLKVQYVPEHAQLGECVELGRTVGKAMQALLARTSRNHANCLYLC